LETTLKPIPGAPEPSFDMAKTAAFMNRIVGDLSGAVISTMCAIGDRLGLFKALAAGGPATSEDLANRAHLNERYVREWLSAMASAGYLQYNPEDKQFTLPVENIPVLAGEGGPFFMGGVYQHLPGLFRPLDKILQAFQQGGGVSQDAYDNDFREGMERISAGWFDNMLVHQWIAALPDVKEKLERGATAADIGCGSGRALINLAKAFPKSRFVGYDVFGPSIERATANAEAAGVSNRVRFVQRDVRDGLLEQYDLITTFDVLHDIANPETVIRGIRQGIRQRPHYPSDGTFLLLEIKCSDRLEENAGPVGAILFGTSVMYCTPTAIANGAEGLGTMGMPESKIRKLCEDASFTIFRRLPFENPFNVLYEIKP
jgi:SAM-dependent methyltransferase